MDAHASAAAGVAETNVRHGYSLFNDPALGFILLAVGVALIAVTARYEAAQMREQPWSGTLFCTDGEAPWDGAYTIHARRVPIDNFENQVVYRDDFKEAFETLPDGESPLDLREWLSALEAPPETLYEIF